MAPEKSPVEFDTYLHPMHYALYPDGVRIYRGSVLVATIAGSDAADMLVLLARALQDAGSKK